MDRLDTSKYKEITEQLKVDNGTFVCSYIPVYGLIDVEGTIKQINDKSGVGVWKGGTDTITVRYLMEKTAFGNIFANRLTEEEVIMYLKDENNSTIANTNTGTIYYAHCMSMYDSKQEERDIELIQTVFPNRSIYNPSKDPHASYGYKERGMDYFLKIVEGCSLLVLRGLPYGRIPAGIFKEVKHAMELDIPVMELPTMLGREMSVEETREYLKEVGYR